ncbi:hypothetical protein EJ03DRAFT_347120 [Teratosphaeria nubilosa]|uniref:MOSC domain-containing protein n=1 Tax=Teratosphaeria nubilosa TaxID=161662 RepID=A0A6G1LNX1_9PEZI|nr:hypothetical protein EJ03DRAFT_347120 [Teratosphaeria nubilosa]
MSAEALIVHYLDYLSSPAVLLAILIVVGPVVLSVTFEKAAGTQKPNESVPGCRRIGLRGRSNLDDQYKTRRQDDKSAPRVKALFTYPVKSCRGVELNASEVEASGLKYDRLFTFAQLVSKPIRNDSDPEPSGDWNHQWRFITEREFPRLVRLKTQLWIPDLRGNQNTIPIGRITCQGQGKNKLRAREPQPRPRSRSRGNTLMGQLERGKASNSVDWAADGGCLLLQFMFEPDFNPLGLRTEIVTIKLPLAPTPQRAEAKHYEQEELSIWTDNIMATNMTNEIDGKALAKLKYYLGVTNPLAIFRVDERHKRQVTRSLPKDRPKQEYKVGFVDAFPVNILGMSSVRATDEELPANASAKGKLDARRFRANVYITGTPSFEEDKWKKILLGRRIGRDEQGLFETEAEYHVACRTARCTLPNVDPETGVKDRNEPYTTLGKTRKVDEGAYPHSCLGMQTIPLFERGFTKVGDSIEVLETGEHRYEKMFP